MRLLQFSYYPDKSLTGLLSLNIVIAVLFLFIAAGCSKNKGVENECHDVALQGSITPPAADGTYTFRTSGGGTITVNPQSVITIRYDEYPTFRLEFWGDTLMGNARVNSGNHENLIGKHLKDRFGSRRSVVLPDGSKITMVADGEIGPLISVTIYDGDQSHRIGGECRRLVHSSASQSISKEMDEKEADGETATIEITPGGLNYLNIYTEATPGSKVMKRELLGELFRNEPNRVRDHFDDPRFAHT